MNLEKIRDFVKVLDEKLAQDIIVIDMEKASVLYDAFIICSADNMRLSKSLVDYLEVMADQKGYVINSVAGAGESDWVLIDAQDVIVHIFSGNARHVYNLEKLWSDCDQMDGLTCMKS